MCSRTEFSIVLVEINSCANSAFHSVLYVVHLLSPPPILFTLPFIAPTLYSSSIPSPLFFLPYIFPLFHPLLLYFTSSSFTYFTYFSTITSTTHFVIPYTPTSFSSNVFTCSSPYNPPPTPPPSPPPPPPHHILHTFPPFFLLYLLYLIFLLYRSTPLILLGSHPSPLWHFLLVCFVLLFLVFFRIPTLLQSHFL